MLGWSDIPHDNFYKFIAYAGLALLIASIYWGESADQKVSDLALEIEKRADHSLDQQKINNEILANLNKRMLKEDSRENLYEITDRELALIQSHIQESREIDKLLGSYKLRELEAMRANLIGNAGMIVGLVLLVVGCSLWFFRIQLPQDRALSRTHRNQESRKRSARRLIG